MECKPSDTEINGFPTMTSPSTLGCQIFEILENEKMFVVLLTIAMNDSKGTRRRQPRVSGDPVQLLAATSWS